MGFRRKGGEAPMHRRPQQTAREFPGLGGYRLPAGDLGAGGGLPL